MMGMRLLRPSSISAQCEQCRRRFDLVYGGVCSVCGRILCDDHLHGSFWRRWRVYLGGAATCIACTTQRGRPV
jgi:hypothetical protein